MSCLYPGVSTGSTTASTTTMHPITHSRAGAAFLIDNAIVATSGAVTSFQQEDSTTLKGTTAITSKQHQLNETADLNCCLLHYVVALALANKLD